MAKKTWKIMIKIQRMRKYNLVVVRNLRILIRAIHYFVCYGVPAMWKSKSLSIKVVWFAGIIQSRVDFYRAEKKNNKYMKGKNDEQN